ncbi:hypothetical protein GCM10011344_17980 [Dokdonia pacifica]|uniref:Uncharacterized protein n=1 Tax=Dokdonia pacifica TaxID=1627892 RepID=A0A238VTE6_9FLAO|nr:hypothetical protein [Dokdonia pacifica]GGG17768.1 hypothetical protein GCM10011344_17980 [Dokdonia pacifica]SNR37592.1 hypothetical protein SAMN06265376_101340 [Dokdonia pacifica]
MTNYVLTISFTDQQLTDIYNTNTQVTIGKQVNSQEPNVAWQSFNPLQNNQVTWEEEYGIYASNSEIVNGTTIVQLSNTPTGVPMDQLYTLEPSGVISGPSNGGASNAFALLNEYSNKDYMTIGLLQDAIVNGTDVIGNAVSAVPVLLASTALMTPSTTLYIWLQSEVTGNSIVTVVTSPMTQLKFGNGVTNIAVEYDTESGNFITVQN